MLPPFLRSRLSKSGPTAGKEWLQKDPQSDDIGIRVFCVRDVDVPDIGIAEMPTAPKAGLKSRGSGDLWSRATDDIEETIDIEEHVGEEVAEVAIDVDEWDYHVEYLVDVDEPSPSLRERAVATVRGVMG